MVRTKFSGFLREDERGYLHTLVGQGVAPARRLTHARILLKANQGEGGPAWTDAVIAPALDVGLSTVARVRQRYVTAGLAAALARKAPDRQSRRTLDGEQEAHLVALACSTPPAGRQRWTLRLLAAGVVALDVVDTISHETVGQTLQQTNFNRT